MRLMTAPIATSHSRAFVAFMMVVLLTSSFAQAAPRWRLIYRRQIGNNENGNRRTIENHLFREDGTKGSNIGITNASNPYNPIFGITDVDGWARLNPMDENNCAYDIRIYNGSIASDQTPNFYWFNPLGGAIISYSYITQWLYVSDETSITADPAHAVYDYDLMNGGLNSVVNQQSNCVAEAFIEPAGANSDPRAYAHWKDWHAQTFVVPPGVNRIISAQLWAIRGAEDGPYRIRFAIREGGPNGPQIGPTLLSRPKHNTEFKEMAVNWGVNAVPVVPGQTYAMRVWADDGLGFNLYTSTGETDIYPQGTLYSEGIDQGVDMFATIVGVGKDYNIPTIGVNTNTLNPTTPYTTNASPSTFTVRNTGEGTLSYNITDNAAWLSVTPTSGTSVGETDTITVNYNGIASFLPGTYTATITVSAPGATTETEQIDVALVVTRPNTPLADFDFDFDVDLEDFGFFQRCYGIDVAGDCVRARLDSDDDVDEYDWAIFQSCLTGANIMADPDCGI